MNREWTYGWLPGLKVGGGIIRESGSNMYTLLYLEQNTNNDRNSAQYYVWMAKKFVQVF